MLQKVTIGHDNSGPAAAWHLDRVLVTAKSSGNAATFPCCRWLAKTKDDGRIERVLLPEGQQEIPDACSWELRVWTANERGAGTSANVYMEIHGSLGIIGPKRLDDNDKNFVRGANDLFIIQDSDIGMLQELHVWHDGKGPGPSWRLEMVEVKNTNTDTTWWFLANCWISEETGLRHSFKPTMNDPRSSMLDYRAVVHTGAMKGASTDAGDDATLSCLTS